MAQQSNNGIAEKFDASTWRVGIVVARFNAPVTEALCAEALRCFREYGMSEAQIDIEHVSGAVEIPLVLSAFAKKGGYACLVALGAVIRGETPHFDYVARAVTDGVMRVQLDTGIPIGFGVLTVENDAQAHERLQVGYSSAEAALQSAKVISKILKKE